ncbi:autotransporter domain-containing protein [Bradyrhizobium sp. OK095]|uniref:autotransporter domain-containing protein n=1 Tax=Bradyrhizobium sp. OK095 TaxID=1882760 RepID=UPI0008AECEA1|nr:autotransporter domain-containing protein [Bradyrhizobium sp. OK095]SEM97342.1 T5SS/PEP-CTERM-associated repeat-containing protein [Bradyrhizobium sp. OK095]
MTKPHAKYRAPQSARARGYAALLLAGTALAGMPLSSPAQAQTWNGAVSTDWFTTGNWSTNAVPTSATMVTIDTTSPHATVIGTSAATSGYVDVGQSLTGALTISGGGTLNASGGVHLGVNAGGSGTVTVTGVGSSLTESGTLEVGYFGTGVLQVQNGGAVLADNASIASYGNGSVTVDGAGSSLHVINDFRIGDGASGALTVSNSGTLVTSYAALGWTATGTGFATVDGAGSAWNSSLDLVVGDAGGGVLTVSNGGSVTNYNGVIGNQAGSIGNVTVDGAGSTWASSQLLSVGSSGTGALTVSNGGAVSSTGASVGDLAGSNGNLTVTGAGSTLTSTGVGNQVIIGNSGTGSLQIANGGVINDAYGIVGNSVGGAGTATVDGLGSQWNNTGYLIVGAAGGGSLTIANGGVVSDGAGGFIGTVAGGTGSVSVSGANSAWANVGAVIVGNSGTGTLTVSNGGTVMSNGGTAGNFAGSSGSVTVTGANSVWGGGAGDITLGAYGSGSMVVSNGGRISNANAVLGQFAGSTGTATVDGAGSSWTNAGAFQVGIGGNGSVTISNGGAVVAADSFLGGSIGTVGTVTVTGTGSAFLNSGNILIANAGTGSLTVANGGTVSAGGSITIASAAGSTGALNIGADAASAAAAPGTVTTPSIVFGAGSGSINFNHTSTGYAFTTTVSGAGTINQIAGTTILGNNFSTFTGVTNVTGGRLAVNGSLAGSTVTVSGGTLGGTGTVGSTIVNGGTLAPGNSIGTLTVQGNLAFTSAGHYSVELSPTAADLTNVTGTATLGGATVNASFGPGSYVAKQYTIVNATGGVSGTFAAIVNTNLPSGFMSSLSYDANDVYLNLGLGFTQYSGLNVNQQNVANALTNFFNTNGGIQAVFGSLTPAGLTQVSGETATGTQQTTFNAMNMFMGVLTDPFVAGRGDPRSSFGAAGYAAEDSGALAYADRKRTGAERDAYAAISRKAPVQAFEQRWAVWAAGFGGAQTTDGNASLGSNTATSRIAGAVAGADYWFSPSTVAGFALAGGGTNFSVANGGTGRSDLFQAGAFVRHNAGAAYVTGALAYGWQDITTDRTVTVAGADHLQARFNANAYSGRLEGGYRLIAPWTGGVGLTPYAAAQFTTFDLPAYAEQAITGNSTFALSYASKSVTDTRSELGLRTDKSFAMADGVATLRGRLAWAHDFNPDRSIGATFQALPGASFVVNGAAQAADAALVTASVEKTWLNGWSTAATFEGEFSNVTRSYAGKGTVRYGW